MNLQQFEPHVKINTGGRKWRSCVVVEEVSPHFGCFVTLHPVFRDTEQQSCRTLPLLITTHFIKWRLVLRHVCSTCDSPPHLQPVTQHLWWNQPEHWLTEFSSDEGFVHNTSCRVTRPAPGFIFWYGFKIWTESADLSIKHQRESLRSFCLCFILVFFAVCLWREDSVMIDSFWHLTG